MSQYDDTNRGALFRNAKEGNDKRPDYRGPLNVNGEEFEMAAWLRESKNGKKFLSISVQPKRDRQEAPQQGSNNGGFDSDIPFISCDFSHDDSIKRRKRWG